MAVRKRQPSLFDEGTPKPESSMQSLSDLIKLRATKPINKYVSREYQDYGYRLAMDLDDESHKSLYIRMAKTIDRGILEQARTFVIDSNAFSRAKLFMWKVKQIKDQKKSKSK
jgi:hypothetical protein